MFLGINKGLDSTESPTSLPIRMPQLNPIEKLEIWLSPNRQERHLTMV